MALSGRWGAEVTGEGRSQVEMIDSPAWRRETQQGRGNNDQTDGQRRVAFDERCANKKDSRR